jgi:predicted metal-dependent hydrolase
MRDDKWLFQQLDECWDTFFSDIPQDNDVRIVWGRKARQRLGSIKKGLPVPGKHPETIITINSLFKDEKIPEYVVQATIVHELAHYAHGFHSPLEQKFEKPHEGGIVHRELDNRGAKKLEQMSKRWLKENWREYLEKNLPRKVRTRKKRRILIKWI